MREIQILCNLLLLLSCFFFLEMVITLHLSGWNSKSHLFDHPCNIFKSFCRVCIYSFDLFSRNPLVSYANINTSEITLSGRSFMYRTNKIGPRTFPCGITLRTSIHAENCSLTDTRCLLFDRNDVTHLTIFHTYHTI